MTKRTKSPTAKTRTAKAASGKMTKVDAAEAERMFKFYARIARKKGGYEAVAQKFGRGKTTIIRMARKYNWAGRLKKIETDVQNKTDRDIKRTEMTNARLAVGVRNKTVQGFLTKADMSRVTATDVVKILQYCDDIGVGGEGPADQSSVNNPEAVAYALIVVKKIGEKALAAVGDWIVHNLHNLKLEDPDDGEA